MQKYTLLSCSLCALAVLGIGLSSCKDDDPFVKPNLSVSAETLTVAEAAGTIQVEFVLDGGAPEDLTIEYELGGTATSPADYTIVGSEGEVDIAKGQTSGVVQIQIVSDAVYEGNETIEVSIQDVTSDNVVLTNDDETVVTITDDDPQITASFPTATLTINESENQELLELQVSLSSPALQATTIQYQLTHGQGFAVDHIYAAAEEIPGQYIDFGIEGDAQEVTIAQGATSGVIQFQLVNDLTFEDPEKIEITLTQSTGGVQIGTNNKMTVNVEQSDGKVIVLVWQDDYDDVDMDMFLWAGNTPAELEIFGASINPGVDPKYEVIFIPAVVQDAAFGMSYTYYEGTQTPMNFEAHFIDFTDGELAATLDNYAATYTLANINKWDATNAPDPAVVQTFKKVAGAYVDVTAITVPATGSRIQKFALPEGLRKYKQPSPGVYKKLSAILGK